MLENEKKKSYTTFVKGECVQVKFDGTQAEHDEKGDSIRPGDTKVKKVTETNASCLKTAYARSNDPRLGLKWIQAQECVPISQSVELSKSEFTHDMIVIH